MTRTNCIASTTFGLTILGFAFAFVPSPQVRAQELIKPAPDMPVYTLGGIQQTQDPFGKPTVSITYKRNIPNPGFVKLTGRTADGPLDIIGGPLVLTEQSGTIQLSSLFGRAISMQKSTWSLPDPSPGKFLNHA